VHLSGCSIVTDQSTSATNGGGVGRARSLPRLKCAEFRDDAFVDGSSQSLCLGRLHSYLRLSTGSSFAALVAGTVPNTTPTRDETRIATIADRPEMGMRYSVRNRTE
jgi:hypothetical protein